VARLPDRHRHRPPRGRDAPPGSDLIEYAAVAGILLGLGALWRGLRAQRVGARVEGLANSRIATLAAGEVSVSGTVETAGVTLISPILARECIYYDAKIRAADDESETSWHDTRAVGFFVRDASGSIRVLPRAARWDVPLDVDDSSGLTRPMGGAPDAPGGLPSTDGFSGLALLAAAHERPPQRMTEAVLEPGDPVTVVGYALPYRDLTDPASADAFLVVDEADPEVAGDLAEAREAGILEGNAEDAWGNAAIPGFGIGQPTRAPELDPAATRSSAIEAEAPATGAQPSSEPAFEIPDHALVLASTADVPLIIAGGVAQEVATRSSDAFLLGLLGAVLAIGSAIVLAVSLAGWIG